jgi:hypothetical protein
VAYAFDVLKADGVCMRTPYGNVWHGEPVFAPLYEELNRRNAVVFTHPQDAPCCDNLVPGVPSQSSIEYGTHTTRTIVSLLESGMAARYPNIRWVFAHAGGTMPFLLARIVGRKLPVGPDGIEDHTHVPSSATKVVTERWHKLNPTRMDITYTVEDRLFLKKPLVFTWHYEKVPPPLPRNQVNFVCDPDVSWAEAQIAAPSRYTEE